MTDAPCKHRTITPGCPVCEIASRDARYAALFGFAPAPPAPGAAPPAGGPGTELTALLESLGIGKLPGCQCAARAAQMDRWGVGGCRGHRSLIVGWLGEGYAAAGWPARLRAGASALASGLALSADPLGALADEAIRRAEEKARASWPKRYDETNLWPGEPGLRFNPSILAHEGGYLLAYRTGWKGSEIYLGRLDAALAPVGRPWLLRLRHPAAQYGREDPRLFVHEGRVHVSFVGVMGVTGPRHTNILYARLGQDLSVEKVYAPHYNQRQLWEKNWGFFSHEGSLLAVYSIAPHRVLLVEGDRARPLCEVANALPWDGGERRGGASSVRVGDEYWHFFHDRVEVRRQRIYRTGLMTFSARPPFAPLRQIPEPILTADLTDKPPDQYAFVAFVCGAVRVGDYWILSHGRQDRFMTLDRFRHDDLERKLVSL